MFERVLKLIYFIVIEFIFIGLAVLGASVLIFDSSIVSKILGGLTLIMFSFLISIVYLRK